MQYRESTRAHVKAEADQAIEEAIQRAVDARNNQQRRSRRLRIAVRVATLFTGLMSLGFFVASLVNDSQIEMLLALSFGLATLFAGLVRLHSSLSIQQKSASDYAP